MDARNTLRTADVRRRFDRAAAGFDDADFVHAVTRAGLFERLKPVTIDADLVLDLGCATGAAMRSLSRAFRRARIVGVDVSQNMLQQTKAHRGWFSRTSAVQADARALPFGDKSVDVVFSNLLLPWIDNPGALAGEVSRVLREGGLFIFSTLGPDSLLELRNAWAGVDAHDHVNRFIDMHDVGDILVRAGLHDPVLDMDRLAVTYDDAGAVFRDLTRAGARNSLESRGPALTGRGHFDAMRQRLEHDKTAGKIRFELELVYGHCWGAAANRTGSDVHIDPGAIPIRRG